MTDYNSGLFAIKEYRESISQDDFNKAVRKVAESKKLYVFNLYIQLTNVWIILIFIQRGKARLSKIVIWINVLWMAFGLSMIHKNQYHPCTIDNHPHSIGVVQAKRNKIVVRERSNYLKSVHRATLPSNSLIKLTLIN